MYDSLQVSALRSVFYARTFWWPVFISHWRHPIKENSAPAGAPFCVLAKVKTSLTLEFEVYPKVNHQVCVESTPHWNRKPTLKDRVRWCCSTGSQTWHVGLFSSPAVGQQKTERKRRRRGSRRPQSSTSPYFSVDGSMTRSAVRLSCHFHQRWRCNGFIRWWSSRPWRRYQRRCFVYRDWCSPLTVIPSRKNTNILPRLSLKGIHLVR